MTGEPPRLRPLGMSSASGAPPRHETVLNEQPPDAQAALGQALAAADRTVSLPAVVARWPAFLDGWAYLAQVTWRAGDSVASYAYARTGYHRGLDALRRQGWGGTGLVRWERESNRGFLRSLHMLLVSAASLDERDEAERCRRFLLDLDPDDGIGAGDVPENPGPEWAPDHLP